MGPLTTVIYSKDTVGMLQNQVRSVQGEHLFLSFIPSCCQSHPMKSSISKQVVLEVEKIVKSTPVKFVD